MNSELTLKEISAFKYSLVPFESCDSVHCVNGTKSRYLGIVWLTMKKNCRGNNSKCAKDVNVVIYLNDKLGKCSTNIRVECF